MRAIVSSNELDRRNQPSALRVVEELATATGTALLEDDFPSFARRFLFPHFVVTQSGDRQVNSLDELRITFDQVIDHYRLSGVDRMERYCVYGRFSDIETIECAHETRLFQQDKLVQQPFIAQSVLKLQSGEWKIYSTEYMIADSLRYLRALTQ
ncbi:MAG: hypothetical protein AAGF53_18655 [Pseudomonadota bacterium]